MASGRQTLPNSLARAKSAPLSERIKTLTQTMRTYAATGKALDFGEPSHREITEALRIVAYQDSGASLLGGETKLKVAYGTEPSRGWSISLGGVVESEGPSVEARLRVGTLSFRHLDYDSRIDLYLIRDRETRKLSSSDIDKLAYERMKEVLTDRCLRRADAGIELFQTGLAPLVAGAYRALIEELLLRRQERLPRLQVQPVFYADGETLARGRLWH